MTHEEYQTKLNELITRFCYRNGRHGETYLLEKGLAQGLAEQLTKLRNEDINEVIGENEKKPDILRVVGKMNEYKTIAIRNDLRVEQKQRAGL